MTDKFNHLFQYIDKENINIDKEEFLFQIQSHPDYPSLLAIADTLSFFNIDNGAMRIDSSEIDFLPNQFIALLSEVDHKPELYFVERKENTYFCKIDKKVVALSKLELESQWKGIVLLVEKQETKEFLKPRKSYLSIALQIFGFVLFVLVLSQFEVALTTNFFFVFPIIGILFSIAALKDLFGAKSELLNSFCNMTASTSCTTVVGSTQWKIFEIVNFSDLSIVFFASQFLGLLVFLFSGNTTTYFAIQQILLLAAVPILFLSVYYQKFVEKKWCPICLVIISIILLELGYLFVFQNTTFTLPSKELIVFGFVFLSVMLAWSALKKLLTSQKELKEYQLKSLRFERNYTIFKNSLLAKDKVQLPQSPIILGNKESNTIITIISSPFCGHCKEAHEVIENILEKYHNNIQIQVLLKTNLEAENEERKKLFRSLMGIYKQDGETVFIKALKYWFDNKNLTEWFGLFPVNTTTEFDTIFDSQYKWCEENDYNFTPAIFINGYEYPQMYDRKNLPFYINELVEDSF
ncbi:MAG: thioredoxin domain-containing protein [Flavobacterium sp.]|jgi:hypothetical protein|uniref:vitamin K epoxide reductase family protein n=1 Tax=Flavobacterium sp. TaxID=239 RepID=UPI0022BC887B|nr:vitamin K epoxide reductase family protein [Flavobacterium sp.]MCZ8331336.1 thioredoxin domain-containing protein [Flavobacterium sp.]